MNKELILKIRNQAIDNVSSKRKVKGQIERTWLQDDFDLEFARLIVSECCELTQDFYNDDDPHILVNAAVVLEDYFRIERG